MKISSKQSEVLIKLSNPYPNGEHHPKDAYNLNILNSLEKKELVEFYRHSRFLHGAVKLTKLGEEIVRQDEKKFRYQGIEFKGIKQLKDKESDFFEISKKINDSGLTPTGWNYEEFYEAAKKVQAEEFDLFDMNGKIVIPGENYLFEYRG